MRIGPARRVIEVEPVDVPLPTVLPEEPSEPDPAAPSPPEEPARKEPVPSEPCERARGAGVPQRRHG